MMRMAVPASVAVLVGFGSTVALVVQAAQAVGATPAQTVSWVAALALGKAIATGFMSWRWKMPVMTAWSTPGAALIAGTAGTIPFDSAVGAFLVAGLLMIATATFRPLATLVQRIPTPIAAAMLAGILIRFVLALFEVMGAQPALVLPLVLLFFLLRLWSPHWAVLLSLLAGVVLAWLAGGIAELPEGGFGTLVPTMPVFDPGVLIGLAVPLWLVTMAGQNLPGFAVLRAAGYHPPVRPIVFTTGLVSTALSIFGAHGINLAAITAAICTGPEVDPDPARRWLTGPPYALGWLLLAIFAGSLVGIIAALPPALIAAIAGLALIAPLTGALGSAMAEAPLRLAAAVTLTVTASGLSLLGIGAAFWGLLGGLTVMGLDHARNYLR